MDQFGISTALLAAARIYFQTARDTGRTTRFINSLKDGDRVVFCNPKDMRHFQVHAHQMGRHFECVLASPKRLAELQLPRRSGQRTVFDHTWLEEYWLAEMEKTSAFVSRFEAEMSIGADVAEEQRVDIATVLRQDWKR